MWRLDESSGTRVDSYGTNNLADNATVTQATGKINSAAQFTSANSEYLSIADNAALSAGDVDFSFGAWVYLDSKTATMTVLGKWNGGSSDREYQIVYNNPTDRFIFRVRNTGNTSNNTASADNLGSPSTGTWYFIVVWHDATANEIGIQVNNGTANTISTAQGVRDSGNAFHIGADSDPTQYWNGRIDNVYFSKKVWSTEEKTILYNDGIGKEWPF